MKKLIHDFAQGKIQIKYYLVKSQFPRKKRRLITVLTALFSIVLIGLSAKYYGNTGVSAKWPLIVFTIFFLVVPSFVVGKWLLRVSVIGKIFFFEDHLEIHEGSDTRSIMYFEIIRIEYCGELPKDLLQSRIPSYKTYSVKIFTGIKEHFILHVSKEIFVLPEEKEHFRRVHPILPTTLKAVKPRYGTLEDSEL